MLLLLSSVTVLAVSLGGQTRHKQPHIVHFLADDVGYNEVGWTEYQTDGGGKRVHTPTMDTLVSEGIRLNRHYNYKICGPSRSSILSGRLAVHVQISNGGGLTTYNPNDPFSGYAGIPRNMTTIATKMKYAGYRTHAVGKWDAGMATPKHTPFGRDFETWLGYYNHANDYWSKTLNLEATGNIDSCLNAGLDFSELSKEYRGGVRDKHALKNTTYEEWVFKQRALEIIYSHNSYRDEPLFLFYSSHLIHTPLEVPVSYIQKVNQLSGDSFETDNQRLVAAMINYQDDVIAELVYALKSKQMWQDTLFVYFTDNGGAAYLPGSSTNHPLYGGKYSDWEGGVRSAAFVSGGFVPHEKRGTDFNGTVSNADWYATFCTIAGLNATFCLSDADADEANHRIAAEGWNVPFLPRIDSRPQWDNILAGTNGRRDPLHLSPNAILRWPYKLVTGLQNYSFHQGNVYPNATTVSQYKAAQGPGFYDSHIFGHDISFTPPSALYQRDCDAPPGCLFDVEKDPGESNNLAGDRFHAYTLGELQRELACANQSLFEPDRGGLSKYGCIQNARSGGFYGPFVPGTVDDWYSPVKPVDDFWRLKASYTILNNELVMNRTNLFTSCWGEFMHTACGELFYAKFLVNASVGSMPDKTPPTPVCEVDNNAPMGGIAMPPLMYLLLALLFLHVREGHPGAGIISNGLLCNVADVCEACIVEPHPTLPECIDAAAKAIASGATNFQGLACLAGCSLVSEPSCSARCVADNLDDASTLAACILRCEDPLANLNNTA